MKNEITVTGNIQGITILRQSFILFCAVILRSSENITLKSIKIIAVITAVFCFCLSVSNFFIVNFMNDGTIKIHVIIKFIGDDQMNLPFYSSIKAAFFRTARSLQLDTDRSFLLEFNSEGAIRINGISDIKDYDEYRILVVSEKYVTEIRGNGLFMRKFSDAEISICGNINSINFIRR